MGTDTPSAGLAAQIMAMATQSKAIPYAMFIGPPLIVAFSPMSNQAVMRVAKNGATRRSPRYIGPSRQRRPIPTKVPRAASWFLSEVESHREIILSRVAYFGQHPAMPDS